jgi:hypothetical protein
MDSVFAGWSKPATASISRPVTTTDIGDERSPATGCSARVALICGRRSGEALRTSQSRTLAVTASEACDREIAAPPCAPGHSDALQFHCGKPPPAADRAQPYQHGLPRRLRRAQKAKRLLDLSASVRVDLQPHRDLDDDGCLPLHCCIPRSDSCRWQKSCSATAALQWRVGETRDRGLAVGNRWRGRRLFPPHWYSRNLCLRR